jgi:hypothetical protein
MKVRCKFVCQGITKRKGWSGWGHEFLYDAEFQAVTDGSPEDKAFHAATPSGSLKFSSILQDAFEPGKSYYLDITPAE